MNHSERVRARVFVLSAAAVATTIAMMPPAEAQQRVRWKMHSAWAQNVSVIGPPGFRMADTIREMSEGKFDIKVFEPGALAGGNSYYDPVSKGAFEMAYGTPGNNQGKNSAYAFYSSWPFGPGVGEFTAWLKQGGGEKMVADLYAKDNIKFMFCGMISPESSGWFRKPVNSLEELKGFKMRFFGMGAKVMQKFGVSTQQIPGGDIYPALELGTIDATEFSMPSIDRSYGFYQIAKYNYFPGWHQQATTNELLINMDKWKSLSKPYQMMVQAACDANFVHELAEGEASQAKAMLANEKDGVKNMAWPKEILDQLRLAWDDVVKEEIAGNPDSKAMWDSFSAFHEEYKVWGERGYLK